MTVRIEDLKVGMKVKLVKELPYYKSKYSCYNAMKVYLGKICTIKEIMYWPKECIGIKEDENKLMWDISLIEKIVDDKEKKNKVYTSFDEIKKESSKESYSELLKAEFLDRPISFEFDKCIVNSNCVIAIFERYGRFYKGIARCHPEDKFDLAKGLTIAMLRACKSYLDREIKKLY